MKISNKRKLQQIAFNHSSDIDFQDFVNLYKKRTGKPYTFLVIYTTLASDNSSRFRKIILERNKKAAKISVLSSGKIEKYEFLTIE